MDSVAATAVVSKALDGLFVRQLANAHNIANAGSPGFVPVRVRFEDALRAAALDASGDHANTTSRIKAVAPELTRETTMTHADFRLDLEVTQATETSARYSMLLGMIDRMMQMNSLAINDAKGR
jgi:flagellar basal-body rod protein FlgB